MGSSPPKPVLAGAFIATSLLGSSLLFLVQPMVGRLLLPTAGGSAALWNTSIVFFQTTRSWDTCSPTFRRGGSECVVTHSFRIAQIGNKSIHESRLRTFAFHR